MKLTVLSLFLMLFLFSQPALAGSMKCEGGIIQDNLRTPVTIGQVQSKCGEPDTKQGNVWVYKKGNLIYRLQFDSNGDLRKLDGQMNK